MRQYILDFEQEKLLALGIDLKQALILDYIQKLSKSLSIKRIQQNGKTYFWLKYSKLQQDLPILKFTTRSIFSNIDKLIKIGVLEKVVYKNRMVFLRIVKEAFDNAGKVEKSNEELNNNFFCENEAGKKVHTYSIVGSKLPTYQLLPEANFIHVGSKLLAIVNYNKELNNINISVTDDAVLGLDKDFFLNHFKKMLKSEFSPISYDLIYKSAKIEKQAYVFILTVASVQMVLSGKDAFTSALKNSLVFCLKIKDE